MSGQPLLEVRELCKYFSTPGGKLHAVDGVDFAVGGGRTLGVVGESGCGKSTLGRTVLGLTPATSGRICFAGEDITDVRGRERRRLQRQMQIIFQDPSSSLNPSFIVCDEPVSALDVSIQAQILNLLKQLQQQMGLTYLFITHDMSVVKHISHEIMVMYMGTMVEKCDARALFREPLHPYTLGLLSAIPVPSIHHEKKRIVMQGEITSPINPKPGCRFAARCPQASERCRSQLPPLVEARPGHFVRCHKVGGADAPETA